LFKSLVRPQFENCIQVWNPIAEAGYGKTGESAKEPQNDSRLQGFELRGKIEKGVD